MNQIKRSFDKETLLKIWKGFLIAGGGVGIISVLQVLTEIDFGVYSPFLYILAPVSINIIREWLKGQ